MTARDFHVTVGGPLPSVALSRLLSRFIPALLLGASCRSGEPVALLETPGPAVHALIDSLVVDEARAEDRYVRILGRFGAVIPFAELAAAPRSRLGVLQTIIAQQDGWIMPDPFAGLVGLEYYQDVAGACDVASRFAQRTVARYERLLALSLPAAMQAAVMSNRDDVLAADFARTTACR